MGSAQMRIVAGRWRSRGLIRPRGGVTRPMPDRVKEAIFDIAGSMLGTPGALPTVPVADVFAGSGAMGLEALSRGASYCFFFERDPQALAALRANIDSLGAGTASQIITSDVWTDRLRKLPVDRSVAIIFIDPPYRDSRDASPPGNVCRWLEGVATDGRVAADAMAFLHHEARVEYGVDAAPGWGRVDHRRYGTNAVSVFRRRKET
jgi:16S rRNA (guanine966-N2)-methyltransferase